MRTQIVFDSKNKKISLASCFAKKAQDPKATEYKTLQQVHRDFPDFEIAVRTIKKNTKKEIYFNSASYRPLLIIFITH